MPIKGHKKTDAKTVTLRFRVTPEEANALRTAARKVTRRGLSDWLREVALEEAGRLGVVLPRESG